MSMGLSGHLCSQNLQMKTLTQVHSKILVPSFSHCDLVIRAALSSHVCAMHAAGLASQAAPKMEHACRSGH